MNNTTDFQSAFRKKYLSIYTYLCYKKVKKIQSKIIVSKMSAKQKRLLHSLLVEPPNGNTQWHDIESLLKHLGAKVEIVHGARIHIALNNVETSLHKPHNSNVCSKRDIHLLRDYLIKANIDVTSLD